MRFIYALYITVLFVTACGSHTAPNQNASPQVFYDGNTNSPPLLIRTTPESIGAIHLAQHSSFSREHRNAAQTVAEELIKDGVNPDAFYATIEPTQSARVLIFHLWHKDAFQEENQGVNGNPGGKCRDFYYNVKRQRVTWKAFWQ
jgi:hypothetical protein